jgi:hypothetical protein
MRLGAPMGEITSLTRRRLPTPFGASVEGSDDALERVLPGVLVAKAQSSICLEIAR